jgi:hypothetical protein
VFGSRYPSFLFLFRKSLQMTEGKFRQLGRYSIQVRLFLRKQFAPLGKHRFAPALHIFEADSMASRMLARASSTVLP